jgi:hypothetical protein
MHTRPRQAVTTSGMVLAIIGLALLVVQLAGADHLAWMAPYRSSGGGACCGEANCVPATVVRGPDGEVRVNGVPLRLPTGSVHLAPDGVDTGWWCYQALMSCQPPLLEISAACARCVFVPQRLGTL